MRSTSVLPRRGSRPAVRVRRVPQCDPPFDDELAPEVWAPTHQPTLDLPARQRLVARGRGQLDRGQLGQGQLGQGQLGQGQLGQGQLGQGQLGQGPHGERIAASGLAGASSDAKLAVRRFVGMCVEVLNGYRPPAHLRRLALPMEAAGVVAQAVSGTRRVADMRRGARGVDPRAARPGPVAVLRLRLCEPRPGAVEAAVLLATGERTWAMAVRLERHQQSWAATVLRLI